MKIGLNRVANSRLGMMSDSEMPALVLWFAPSHCEEADKRQGRARLVKEFSHQKHKIYIDVSWGLILLLGVIYSRSNGNPSLMKSDV